MISRRRVVQGLGASFALFNVSPGRTQGNSRPVMTGQEKFFLQIMIDGGLDVVLGLDPLFGLAEASKRPLERDLFIGSTPDKLVPPDETGIVLGEAATSLASLRKDICIINGILMNTKDQAHPSNLSHLRSGVVRDSFQNQSLAVAFAQAQGARPFHVLHRSAGGSFFDLTGGGRVKTYPLTDTLFERTQTLEIDELDEFIQTEDPAGSLAQTYREAMSQARIKPHVVEAHRGLGKYPAAEWMKQVAAFFLAGGSQHAEVCLSPSVALGQMDSHSDHYRNHVPPQRAGWEQIAQLFKFFQSIPFGQGTLFSATTFQVGSEFSRTPYLNGKDGKDHNTLTNSVLLAGHGIRGGQVIGQSLIYTPEELIKINERIQSEDFLKIFIEKDEVRSGHIGARMRFDENKIPRPVGKFEKGWHITPAVVAQTLQRAVGVGGTLDALKKHNPELWLPQAVQPKV